ncbi:hypothetical protein QR680_010414 [Steinernema hermaphroditum]|uniref:Uncharacterized protein n=1 Tax=Steinernema hermaphroditum TaxID=289476 RepID=A0AA39INV7_9BILA|nr:hypothetical protein QR680_010414 [Steinernema hermaphroditum]
MVRSWFFFEFAFVLLRVSVHGLDECKISHFRGNYIVALGKYGFTIADIGAYKTFKDLNKAIDEHMPVARREANCAYPSEETAKLFYTKHYEHLIFAGISRCKEKRLLFDSRKLADLKWNGSKILSFMKNEYPNGCHNGKKFYSVQTDTVFSNSEPVLCDGRSMTFVPNENKLLSDEHTAFIFNKNMTLRNLTRMKEHQCSNISAPQREKVADFFNANSLLHWDKRDAEAKDGAFFYNQLESGKFKLQAELRTENCTEFFYHIVRYLNSSRRFEELGEECYIRGFKKDSDELPRMLIIPKRGGARGVLLRKSTRKDIHGKWELMANPNTVPTTLRAAIDDLYL